MYFDYFSISVSHVERRQLKKIDAISRSKSIEAINTRLNPIPHTSRVPGDEVVIHFKFKVDHQHHFYEQNALTHLKMFFSRALEKLEGNFFPIQKRGKKLYSMKNHRGAALCEAKINIASRNLALAIV